MSRAATRQLYRIYRKGRTTLELLAYSKADAERRARNGRRA